MESNHAARGEPIDTDANGPGRLPAIADWVAGALIALAGMALSLSGAFVLFVVNRPRIAEEIAETATSGELLAAGERVDVILTTGNWIGWGLALTGGAMVVVAIAYVVHRHRVHSRVADGEDASDLLGNAVVGSVVSAILSFVPFSPVFGGAIAGYYESAASGRVVRAGALSGLLAAAPLVAIVGFVGAGLAVGLGGAGQSEFGLLVAVVMAFAMAVIATVSAGLGAVGGWAGERLA